MPREAHAVLSQPAQNHRLRLIGGKAAHSTWTSWKPNCMSCVWPYTLLLGCNLRRCQVSRCVLVLYQNRFAGGFCHASFSDRMKSRPPRFGGTACPAVSL